MQGFRSERDSMGEVFVPSDALYGAQTRRAVENFPISGMRLQRPFIGALGTIKAAAAVANVRVGALPPSTGLAIVVAAHEVAEGCHDFQFVVDVFQTGSGTSTNMNANEVIARLATQGHSAEYGTVHPNDHVNRSQSSNDVIPTAMHVAAAQTITQRLFPAMSRLYNDLSQKARMFQNIVKIGRTHLQDAVPIRLGQEFGGYARQVALSRERIESAMKGIYELPLGGTAVGTGLNAPPGFARIAIEHIAEGTGLPFREAEDHFEAQSARDAVVFLSGSLRSFAISLTKIANDIRWMGSGPRCGLGELLLPALQPGSSIMPGKVNPVIAESVLMACAQVIGYDATISWCGASGTLELNTMMPLMAFDLLESIELLATVSDNFATKCIEGIEVDREHVAALVERSLALCTPLTKEIGYEAAAEVAKVAYQTGRNIRDIAREYTEIPEETLSELLDVRRMTGSDAATNRW